MDRICKAFLDRQYQDALELNEASDLVNLIPLMRSGGDMAGPAGPLVAGEYPPQHYIARFLCKGAVRAGGEITEWADWSVGIWLPDDYLRTVNPADVLTWISPPHVYHPNIRPPFVCLGHLKPGTGLVDIVYRLFDMIRLENVTTVETDSLNPESCSWARGKIAAGEFPIDKRPLKRRTIDIQVSPRKQEAST